jgi:hypothetical protein
MLHYHQLANLAYERHQQALAEAEQRRLLAATSPTPHGGVLIRAIRTPFRHAHRVQTRPWLLSYLWSSHLDHWPSIGRALPR